MHGSINSKMNGTIKTKANGNGVHVKQKDINFQQIPSKSKKEEQKPFLVKLPSSFVKMCTMSVIAIAFILGQGVKKAVINNLVSESTCQLPKNAITSCEDNEYELPKSLPAPVIPDGKQIPEAIYTSKNFNIAASVRSSNPLIQKKGPSVGTEKETTLEEAKLEEDNLNAEECCEEEHLPAGQHLLVDIKNVDGEFLNDEGRLAQAMIDVVQESKLTLLSYHCHALEPIGVSCAGVLLESHVTFHTWPEEGVITLDLFTCGPNSLLPVLKSLVKLFAIPTEGGDPPAYIWAHKLRGFREKLNPLSVDLGRYLLGVIDFDTKEEVVDLTTDYQDIHIYDVISPRFHSIQGYERSLSNETSYYTKNPELFQPDRILYLDGFIQSSRLGDAPYHESLVHPGIFAHPNPRKVAIIGGGEGATLREVLKHDTVDEVVMIEIDEAMINASKNFLSAWNDCSDLIDSADSCFDDPRATILVQDALKFFTNIQTPEVRHFDVIIMDALDPEDTVPFAEALYSNYVFLDALYQDMSDDGIIILQLGQTASAFSPADEMTRYKNRASLIDLLEKVGMSSFFPYDDFHSGFFAPWSFLVACKSVNCRPNWYANEATIEAAIHERIRRTHSGKSPLSYFDGATMKSYQVPHKAFEVVHCRRVPTPIDCELSSLNASSDVLNVVSSQSKHRYSPAFSRRFTPNFETSVWDVVSSMS